ncbi:sushi, von Willebrand factor type A, EGF and pentraxin domain-containing protein 1-like [Dendronephthya gigantea]|uniref:sushi, von Willebrand factor type A, EGF and pentraxin domain-containing protein 1-like n=1 Tax=Dendronephthya gigantea TaxID=151771 RepID=UPI00106BFF6C|nr:sushi, von Willebrand factor type A, EGF and pentraxin domain-containing protein 1-like [Dendronephthya gigantea]
MFQLKIFSRIIGMNMHSVVSHSLSYLLALLLGMLHQTRCEEIENFCFDGNYENRRLNNTRVLQYLHSNSGPECVLQCLNRDKCCRSINYKKSSQCEKNCELLSETGAEKPERLVEDHEYNHYVLLQPSREQTKYWCPDSPCLNGGTCQGGCGKNNSRCICPSPYSGKYCTDEFCADALQFRGNNVYEYGILDAPSTNLNSFTISFWMKTTGIFGQSVLSYAYKNGEKIRSNGILINSRKEGFQMYFEAPRKDAKISPDHLNLYNTTKFRHVCITWQSSDGQLVIYLDGIHNYSTTTLNGSIIRGGGKWVIGQDQDKLGGGFEAGGSFAGELVGIHIWDKILSYAEIEKISSSCRETAKGNYVAFSDFIIYGNVTRYRPDCCNITFGN